MQVVEETLKKLKVISPNARIVKTDEEIVERTKIAITPEEVEGIGYVGVGCSF